MRDRCTCSWVGIAVLKATGGLVTLTLTLAHLFVSSINTASCWIWMHRHDHISTLSSLLQRYTYTAPTVMFLQGSLKCMVHEDTICSVILLTLFPNISSAPPSDCVYEQQPYRHTERFYHPSDSCRLCACTNGTVHCQRRPCPFASCSHPITLECCRSCEGTAPARLTQT